MPELNFHIAGAVPVSDAAAPMLALKLRVTETTGVPIRGVALHAQIRIDPARRRYEPDEQRALTELFGSPADWGRSLRPLLWSHAHVHLPAFEHETAADLPVPCTFDHAVASAKFFGALRTGDVPIVALFSGTIFYEPVGGPLQVAPVSWSSEASFRLPIAEWQRAIDGCYPGTAWLSLRRELVDRLAEHRRAIGAADWNRVIEQLLEHAPQVTP